jgi:hypothetical protein
MRKLNRHVLRLWLALSGALRLPRNVQGGIAWTLGLPPLQGAEDPPPPTDPPADPPADPPPGDGWTPPTKAQWDDLNRRSREASDGLKKLQDEAAERQRKADEEAGNHQAIAQREREAREAAERERDELKREREQDAADRATEKWERMVEKAARGLKFRDPSDVLHRLDQSKTTTEADARKALEALAKEKTYLVEDGGIPKTRDVTGDPAAPGEGNGEAQPTGVDRLSRAYAKSSGSTT